MNLLAQSTPVNDDISSVRAKALRDMRARAISLFARTAHAGCFSWAVVAEAVVPVRFPLKMVRIGAILRMAEVRSNPAVRATLATRLLGQDPLRRRGWCFGR